MLPFYVYILKCSDDSYYIGHTDNLEKRIAEHHEGKGAGYTAKRLPIKLLHFSELASRDEALEMEHKIKKWSRKKKEALIENNWQKIRILARKQFIKNTS